MSSIMVLQDTSVYCRIVSSSSGTTLEYDIIVLAVNMHIDALNDMTFLGLPSDSFIT